MADQHSTSAELSAALTRVFDMDARFDALLRAFDSCAGDAEPSWLFTIRMVYEPAVQAYEDLEQLLYRQVLPILEAHDQAHVQPVLPVGDVVEGEGS